MQFIINLFGTVQANKDVTGKHERTGLRNLDHKLRTLENCVDFLLREHYSQELRVKTYAEYTSENAGVSDREGGGTAAECAEDIRRTEEVHADVPAGDTEAGRDRPSEGEAGAGSGEAPAGEGGPNPSDSHGEGR